jgi:hypothetical protein
MAGQLSGFEGMVSRTTPEIANALRAWDSHGTLVAEGPFRTDIQDFAADPTGGIVVLERPPAAIESYDAQLRLRWHVDLPSAGPFAGATVDRTGRTLAVWTPGDPPTSKAADAIWIDRDGTAGSIFQLLPQQSNFAHDLVRATQRVGSGLFVIGDDPVQIESLSTVTTPAPGFVSNLHSTSFHMVHDGRGYAILPANPPSDCAIEVVAPSGKSCGKVSFGGCAGLAVGFDGTVVETLPLESTSCGSGNCTCKWQWWSGYFH